MKRHGILFISTLIVFLTAFTLNPTYGENLPSDDSDTQRKKAHTAYKDGNFKEALKIFQQLVHSKNNNPYKICDDFNTAVDCLQHLNRINETDSFIEKSINKHKSNWRLLYNAALRLFSTDHFGYIIAGEFIRGHHRGGGKYVNTFERDRIRALQFMQQAATIIDKNANQSDQSDFLINFARMVMGSDDHTTAWKLQYLSDLSILPDYEEGYGYYSGTSSKGAPVTPDNTPVFHQLPMDFSSAKSDGERWRWLIHRAKTVDPNRTNRVLIIYADFLYNQFGVHTMADFHYFFSKIDDDEKDQPHTYALHTLTEDETMSRLATGISRFHLPDDANFINIYKNVAASKKDYSEQATNKLAQIFENRRQYDTAAEYWKKSITLSGPGHNNYKRKNIDQILGNWGLFEPLMTHPAGKNPSVEYKFRNGTRVNFQAEKIHVRKLLDDVKKYLKKNPGKLDWDKIRISDIGYRLVRKNEKKYIGETVAKWQKELSPREMHFDRRTSIPVPIKKAGAYLLTAKMSGGNTSKIIIWINDTVIVKKKLDQKAWFFVADAATGKPLPKVNLEFFGYRQESTKLGKLIGRKYHVLTSHFSEFTNKNGQVIPDPKDYERYYQWLITATTKQGRLAFLGFSGIWYSNYYDHDYNQRKIFTITDRPVYRPNQSVKFKAWIRHTKYDLENVSM